MAVTFDALKFVDAMEKAQTPREQARAIVEMVRDAQESADVATKGDIDSVRKDMLNIEQRLDAKIDLVRSDLGGQIGLLRWMMGVLIAGVSALIVRAYILI